MPSSFVHPLASAVRAAADGVFPAVDGVVEVVAPDASGTCAVAAFTGHTFVLTERAPDEALFDGIDAFGGAMQPEVLVALAGDGGWVGSLDMVMVRRAGSSTTRPLPRTGRYEDHPRLARARAHRRDVRVFGDERGLVCIGAGLVGRTEIAVELTAATGSAGAGRDLLARALVNLPADELVVAQVAPGNAASVRLFLAAGFTPIGSEVLFRPAG